jgi:acyl-coenzyme A thioesterase PaaI-like protein
MLNARHLESGSESAGLHAAAALERAQRATNGTRDLIGFRFDCEDWVVRVLLEIDERHQNRAGVLHGGIAPLLMASAEALAVYTSDSGVDFAANTVISVFYLNAVKGRIDHRHRHRGKVGTNSSPRHDASHRAFGRSAGYRLLRVSVGRVFCAFAGGALHGGPGSGKQPPQLKR